MYLSELHSICPNCKMYISKIPNVFDQIGPRQASPLPLPCFCDQPLHMAAKKPFNICSHSGVSHLCFVLGRLFDCLRSQFCKTPQVVFMNICRTQSPFFWPPWRANSKTDSHSLDLHGYFSRRPICAAKFPFLPQHPAPQLAQFCCHQVGNYSNLPTADTTCKVLISRCNVTQAFKKQTNLSLELFKYFHKIKWFLQLQRIPPPHLESYCCTDNN